jgi:RNA polymerase sigma factor (sigma-70 family)
MNLTTVYWNDFLKGDNLALGKLYQELFEPLVFISYHRVKNMEVARDIVSELFTALLATNIEVRQTKWQQVASVQAYLKAAVKNKSIDFLRAEHLRTESLIQWPSELPSELSSSFEESLQLLPHHETKLFQLHLDGYSNNEIAQQTLIAEKTVRNRLSLTRRKMALIYNSLLMFAAWIIVH